VQCLLLEDKAVGRVAHAGTLLSWSTRDGELVSAAPLVPLGNIKLLVPAAAQAAPPGELYAKVLRVEGADPTIARLRFTSMSPAMQTWLESRSAL
jgi:hypothetical protein